MNFEITEQSIIGKIDTDTCEDGIFISDHFVCVIDGATSKSDLMFDNRSAGKTGVELLKKALKDIPEECDHIQAADYLSDYIMEFYKQQGLAEKMTNEPVHRLTASLAIYSKFRNEIWLIGDCQCMAGETYYSNKKKIDDLTSNLRAFYIEVLLAQNHTIEELLSNDLSRELILPVLEEQMRLQNSPSKNEFSYSVIDGFRPDYDLIRVIPVKNSRNIILASDGYPRIYNNLEETENYLNYILENDPLCYTIFKSTKGKYNGQNSFDDRAYVKITITDNR